MTSKQRQRRIKALEQLTRQLENVNKFSKEWEKTTTPQMINLWKIRIEAEIFSLKQKLLKVG